MGNINIKKSELDFVRSLGDFDLKMFLSELHDHGWPIARKLLPMIKLSVEKERMKDATTRNS